MSEEEKELKAEQELFLKDLKEGKIIIADVEKTKEAIKYYYIQKII